MARSLFVLCRRFAMIYVCEQVLVAAVNVYFVLFVGLLCTYIWRRELRLGFVAFFKLMAFVGTFLTHVIFETRCKFKLFESYEVWQTL